MGIKDTETTAFLPTEHLSNYLSNAKYLAELYKTGDTIENVMVFNICKQIVSFFGKKTISFCLAKGF